VIEQKVIKFVNHSSVLIQDGSNFILTDPWYEKPAFGSWLPVPPTSIHPAYLLALSKTVENFSIMVSHGHDDHLDDKFLSIFPTNTKIIIPKYKSKGVVKRLENIGFTNIHEVCKNEANIGGFFIRSFIDENISLDDAILTIRGSDFFVVHANDNWQELNAGIFGIIKEDSKNFDKSRKVYMSQCNIADGWPNIYKDYDLKQKNDIHLKRLTNMIFHGLKNAENLSFGNFLNYAGHAAGFVKGKEFLKNITSFTTNDFVSKIKRTNNISINILDMIPGDSFSFSMVKKQFCGISLDVESLKNSSYTFYESYEKVLNCDTYNSEPDSDFFWKESSSNFLNGFNDFVLRKIENTKFNEEIVGFKIVFQSDSFHSQIIVGGEERHNNKTAIFTMSDPLMSELLAGKINWENLYIGFAGEVETVPKNTNIRSVVRWLSMWGYKYQREMR
jgi:hypothetical protein